ncbi:MAG: fibronectin type III domain-containing protein, partial [Bacteroidales bacterium]|nr:fibronectin type III domain-containing protein [Bacteroidales bacterium]
MKTFPGITAMAMAVVSTCIAIQAQIIVPTVHSNIIGGAELSLKLPDGRLAPEAAYTAPASMRMLASRPVGTEDGISFDFGPGVNGTLYYGLVDHVTAKYPQKVFFKQSAKVKDGKASVKLRSMGGKYDLTGWEETGRMVLGYRLIREDGQILFDNRVNITGKGPFQVAPTIIRGPAVFLTGPDAVTLTLVTDIPAVVRIRVNGKEYATSGITTTNELIEGLQPSTAYEYTVEHDGYSRTHSFSTAPLPGSRKPFSFAYASDSRNANGGGERNIHGANSYIMKKIAALAAYEG